MDRRAGFLVAVIIALVLGAGGGVTLALVTTSVPKVSADPLGLDLTLDNRSCTGEWLLVLGTGDSNAPLAAVVAGRRDLDPQYLATADSCRTRWAVRRDGSVPEYVAYLGPEADNVGLCTMRMTPEYSSSYVVHLREGNDQFAKCLCVVGAEAAPDLAPGAADDAADRVWIGTLQSVLRISDRFGNPPLLSERQGRTGRYDEATMAAVTQLQQDARGLDPTGLMNTSTWQVVVDDYCDTNVFDY